MEKKVVGVLRYNDDVRADVMRHKQAYKLASSYLSDNDESVYLIKDVLYPKSHKGDEDLYQYTHGKSNEFSKKIHETVRINPEATVYETSIAKDNEASWITFKKEKYKPYGLEKYTNYLDYIDDIYKDKPSPIRFLEGILAKDDIVFAMRETEVGIVRDYSVTAALNGAVTTNINNFSGTDTRLGLITNTLYASSLFTASEINTARGRDKNKNGYITPRLYRVYGNNSANLSRLTDLFPINVETGRLGDNPGGDVVFYDDKTDVKSIKFEDLNLSDEIKENITNVRNRFKKYNDYLNADATDEDVYNTNTRHKIPAKLRYHTPNHTHVDNGEDNLFINTLERESDNGNGNTYKIISPLVQYTNDLMAGKIQERKLSHIGNFFSEVKRASEFDSAVTNVGRSHGRNLLTKKAQSNDDYGKTNGFPNPYCRVWTYHHQYRKYKDSIRPFMSENDNDILEESLIQKSARTEYGSLLLTTNTVLDRKTNTVNFVPIANKVETKKCMFSIENLAWKDVPSKYLSQEQRGPLGGRIMWFPPYELTFNESASTEWTTNNFIGRGEPVYTYKNTTRTGNLNFKILVDHPNILNKVKDMSGTADDSVVEQDILRFFAGCNVLDDSIGKTVSPEPEEISEVSQDPSEGGRATGQKIRIKVYFPNYYSGHANDTGEGKKAPDLDTDFFPYMLYGNDKTSYYGLGNGYEIIKGHGRGLSPQPTVGVTDTTFFYRVDKKYASKKLQYEDNYRDTESYGLNSTTGVTKDGEIIISFLELAYALNKAQDGFLRDILMDPLNFADSENIRKLKEYIIDNRDYCKAEYIGYATDQDSKTSQELAVNRARCLKQILGISGNKPRFEVCRNEYGITVNSELAKKDRMAEVILTIEPNIVRDEERVEELIHGETPVEGETEYGTYSEYDYFKSLETDSPFIFKTLTEKVKYFNPAFHSISPEGFNARLTFLQQCTRQGHTIGVADGKFATSAGNLSFGRMPVCVLRIGDFFYSKVIIKSVNIQYDMQNGTWDMNPEGIGVQPMLATVALTLDIIGGQTLNGPIDKLQNAITFNYYANTGVYDSRADRAYLDGQTTKYTYIFEPTSNVTSEGTTNNSSRSQ